MAGGYFWYIPYQFIVMFHFVFFCFVFHILVTNNTEIAQNYRATTINRIQIKKVRFLLSLN